MASNFIYGQIKSELIIAVLGNSILYITCIESILRIDPNMNNTLGTLPTTHLSARRIISGTN